MTSRSMKVTTTMADCQFNYRLCQLASQFSSNRVDDDLFRAKVPIFIIKLVQLSAVFGNDGEINVIDHARVVKAFRDPLVKFE